MTIRLTQQTIDLGDAPLAGMPPAPLTSARLLYDDATGLIYVSANGGAYNPLALGTSDGWTRELLPTPYVRLDFATDQVDVGANPPAPPPAGTKMRITADVASASGGATLDVLGLGQSDYTSAVRVTQARTGGLAFFGALPAYAAELTGDPADDATGALIGFSVTRQDMAGSPAVAFGFHGRRDPVTADALAWWGVYEGGMMQLSTFDDVLVPVPASLDIILNPGARPGAGLFGTVLCLPQDPGSVPLTARGAVAQTAPLLEIRDATGAVVVTSTATGGIVAEAAMDPASVRFMSRPNALQSGDLYQATDAADLPRWRVGASLDMLLQDAAGTVWVECTQAGAVACERVVPSVGAAGVLELANAIGQTVVEIDDDGAAGRRLGLYGAPPVGQQATPAALADNSGGAVGAAVAAAPVGYAAGDFNDIHATILDRLNAIKLALDTIGITV
ncbi:MAG: hypothetical protein Q8Q14_06350 [Gemmatimonadales bacterium]|nr:hypothetical protein [Gemmatimonadales bacterium]